MMQANAFELTNLAIQAKAGVRLITDLTDAETGTHFIPERIAGIYPGYCYIKIWGFRAPQQRADYRDVLFKFVPENGFRGIGGDRFAFCIHNLRYHANIPAGYFRFDIYFRQFGC